MKKNNNPGADWYVDRAMLRERENSLLRMLVLSLLLCLLFAMTSTLYLANKSKVEPFLALMDKRTGEVTTPSRLSANLLNAQWNSVRHFIGQYVLERESYSHHDLSRPYLNIIAMSSKTIANQYEKMIRPELNKNSPIALFKRELYQTVKIHSITKLDQPQLVDVRFTTEVLRTRDDGFERKEEYRVILKYRFDNKVKSLQDWDRNPLSLQVIHYDRQPIEE